MQHPTIWIQKLGHHSWEASCMVAVPEGAIVYGQNPYIKVAYGKTKQDAICRLNTVLEIHRKLYYED